MKGIPLERKIIVRIVGVVMGTDAMGTVFFGNGGGIGGEVTSEGSQGDAIATTEANSVTFVMNVPRGIKRGHILGEGGGEDNRILRLIHLKCHVIIN